MEPVALPRAQQPTDTAQLLSKADEYTQALNAKIVAEPFAPCWKVEIGGGPTRRSLEHRAALQCAAAFDRSEDFAAAIIEDRISEIIVVRKGENPYRMRSY